MSRSLNLILLGAIVFTLAACAPAITVNNNTTFPVRVIVSAGGVTQTLSPSPGESSFVEAAEGAYRATVIADAEWISYARAVRADLNEQLRNSDALSGAKLLDIIRRLQDIAKRMDQFQAAAGTGQSCSGNLSQESGGTVSVNLGANGTLTIICR